MPGLKARLQWILKDMDVSASELSRRAGLARGHVSTAMVSGDMNLSTAIKLCAVARVSIDWLATGEGAPRSPALTKEKVAEMIRDALTSPEKTEPIHPVRKNR